MNDAALSALSGRWPNDRLVLPKTDHAFLFAQLARPASAPNPYDDILRTDATDSAAVAAFAETNGFMYTETGFTVTGQDTPGWLGPRTNTDQPMYRHRISGQLFGYPATMQLAYYIAAAQEDQSESMKLNRQSIIEITLPKLFPQIVLDSNKNESAALRSYPTSYTPDQKQNLEANFSDYYDLYAPIGLQANSLTVLAPNFMEQLIQASKQFDVEFYGNKLYLTTTACVYDPAVLSAALAALKAQLGYMDRLLQSWNYQPLQQPFDRLRQTTWQGATVKVGRLRLSPGQLIGLIGCVVVLILIMALIF